MTIVRFLTLAALAGGIAAPAAAQPTTYPYPNPYPNPGYPGQGYPGQGYPGPATSFGQIVDALLGNRYDVSDRRSVHRCADAAVEEAWDQYGQTDNRWRFGYDRQWAYNNMRVTAITDVQRRSAGVRVSGLIDSGLLYGRNRPNPNRAADLNFRCNVDFSGVVTNVRVWPNNLYRR